eukprot:5160911-Amphidinium_carterae.1
MIFSPLSVVVVVVVVFIVLSNTTCIASFDCHDTSGHHSVIPIGSSAIWASFNPKAILNAFTS